MYGGSSGSERQRKYYDAFKEKHKGITRWQRDNIQTVLRDKKLRTITGLTFYWPDTRIAVSGYVINSTSICNYPVQSLATAEIVPIGVTYLWHAMKAHEMESFLINTVHDSIEAELHPDEIELFEELAVETLIDDVLEYLDTCYNIQFDVPLDVETNIGDCWADSAYWRQTFLGEENDDVKENVA